MLKTKSIDLGNYNIKCCDDIEFIATFEELDLADQSEDNILELDGKKYAMEKESDFDPMFNKAKKDYLPNLVWALDKMGAEDGDIYQVILGLPINSLGQADTLKDELTGKKITYITDMKKTITIEKVGIVGEGISSYYMLPKDEREKDLIVIDLGGRTTNVVEYKNKKLVKKDTINEGMIDLFGNIKIKYNNTDGADEPLETHEIYHYIQKEQVPLYQDITDKFISDIMKKIKLKFTMIGAINEFERANLLERQREGIALAKAKGKYKGRKEIKIKDFDTYYSRYMRRELNKSQLARELKISRPTLDKLLKEHEAKNKKEHE